MAQKLAQILFAAALLVAIACVDSTGEGEALVKVGRTTLTRDDFGYFTSMARYFPVKNPKVFPAHRKTVTSMLETYLLYKEAPGSLKRSSIRKSVDWQWRERYYHGQLYMMNVLVRNLSFSDAQIEQFYQSHKEDSFKTVIKVTVKDSSADSTADSAAAAAPETRDSTAYKSLGEVRDRIVKHLFIENYPPDSGYIARYFGDSVPEMAVVNEQWYKYMSRYIRTRDQDFFLNRFYKEYYGEELPDTVSLWLGEGKVVTPEDMAIVTSWLPEADRERFETERGQKELGKWALRWKIYARKARETGYADSRDVKKNLEWAWKYYVANEYIDQLLLPRFSKGVDIDTALCRFSYWDTRYAVEIPPDSAGLARQFDTQINRAVAIRLDSAITAMRMKAGVEFLQNDYRDDKEFSADQILTKADSLRDSGSTRDAEKEYRKLTQYFAYTTEGADAFSELAKLLTERQSYKDAIRTYRLHLYHTDDASKMCNIYFMIGFIYDEYLNQPELAEVNYKWVLKNTPDCELADDAEFMMLHLDEPMIRIEDLRAEALRQGRDVDYEDEDEGGE